MKTLFDRETEICSPEPGLAGPAPEPKPEGWRIFVHTKAVLTRSQGILRVEQRCYLRQGNDVTDHPNIKPDMLLEPALSTEEESLSVVEEMHRRFLQRARQQVSEDLIT